MANQEHLDTLRRGADAWNAWRGRNPDVRPDLGQADLGKADLGQADLGQADLGIADLREATLGGAKLGGARLYRADLRGADLRGAFLGGANLVGADLRGADLRGAFLDGAFLFEANLEEANLGEAYLGRAILHGTKLGGADLAGSQSFRTAWVNIDLSGVKGLEAIRHSGPSSVGLDTLAKTRGEIPEEFLRGCGVPEEYITFIPSLRDSISPIQFYSCFISYSHSDEEFARRLHSRMQQEKLRVWYAPEDMKGGEKTHDQIVDAIRLHDKLLLVLSKKSMNSEWVATEIRRARKHERHEGRQVLFPIRLVPFKTIEDWELFDADGGKDLAVEIREYHIPDFRNWKDHDAFEEGFERFLGDLKRENEE